MFNAVDDEFAYLVDQLQEALVELIKLKAGGAADRTDDVRSRALTLTARIEALLGDGRP